MEQVFLRFQKLLRITHQLEHQLRGKPANAVHFQRNTHRTFFLDLSGEIMSSM